MRAARPSGAGRVDPAPLDRRSSAAARALRDGRIVAVKGIGGFHLACRADDERAVAALRARKHREDKPFALMVRRRRGRAASWSSSADEERVAAALAPRARSCSPPAGPGAAVAAAVAPGAAELGVMLPYTPLHHLLLAEDAGAARW